MSGGGDHGGPPKTLYVGNLDNNVTEDLILAVFSQIGPVKGCKIIREPGNDPYCFVEFQQNSAATAALATMNKRVLLQKEIKVNWAASPGGMPKQVGIDTSQHHHIFVGDLSPEIDTETLKNAFAPFGEISDCRVVRDPTTNKSKGYGFCSFVRKNEAQQAIEQMNGQWLGSRSIRTNWATRKPPSVTGGGFGGSGFSGGGGGGGGGKSLDFEEVFNQSSPNNCTVYVGGCSTGDEGALRRAFNQYGRILEVRYFKDKGYAFVRYDNKESACGAIVAVNSTEVGGQIVKCSWGKEGGGGGGGGGDPAAEHFGANQGPGGYPGGNYGGPGGPPQPYGGGPMGPGGPPQPPVDPAQYAQYYGWLQQQAQFNPQYALQLQQYYGPGPGQQPGHPPPGQQGVIPQFQGGAPPQYQQQQHYQYQGYAPPPQGYQEQTAK